MPKVSGKTLDNKSWRAQSDTLLLTDVFESFRNKCLKIYELNPDHFLSAPKMA